ncbi:hypothetical protein CKA34_10425 [Rhizobium sp. 11515TR]|nr:hypothetical protein CKA34_10425 [Rhizobium sp. 11515TR]
MISPTTGEWSEWRDGPANFGPDVGFKWEERALFASPAPLPVAVKALEWVLGYHDNYERSENADGIGGFYHVRHLLRENRIWLVRNKTETIYPTVAEAKAAAQADYETRIRSALSSLVGGAEGKFDFIPCPCTTFEQDENCPVGYPSLLCSACEGKGVATIETVVALAAEMLKVAEQVDELEDPFAAWESIELLKSASSPIPASDIAALREKAEAFDRIVLARKNYVDATAVYNERLELVQAERARGNWSMNTDAEYREISDAQAAFSISARTEADAALQHIAKGER